MTSNKKQAALRAGEFLLRCLAAIGPTKMKNENLLCYGEGEI